ncbi:hypothetical protein PIB30_002189 [Stylosanthes scabra]|uniref:Ninja-family protein n=1 Tax=Stylosanthes scabra TaxID=79078 RepID=A0ABU6S2E9_9FABA|nr:hypothetical protein [Stylosanthes scabra]
METVYGGEEQKKYNNKLASESNKIDLTLKLSPFGNERSTPKYGTGMTFLPCLNKPSSLSSEAEDGKNNGNGNNNVKDEDKRVAPEKRKRYRVTVNGAKFFQVKALLDPSSENLKMQGDSTHSHSVHGFNLNDNASSTEQNDSLAEVEGLDLNTNVSATKQNEKAEGLNLNTNSSTEKQSDTVAPKETTNTVEKAEGLDLNTNASTKKQSDSLTSKKTTMENKKEFDLNTNASTTTEQNDSIASKKTTPEIVDSIASKKTTPEIAEGLNANASATKQDGSLASKNRMNVKVMKGLDLNTDAASSGGEEQNDAVCCCKKTRKKDDASDRFKLENYCSLKGNVMEILRRMPNVTTVGEGPNGRRVEGFLYKYRNGQVCIVCVCHGNFLTPAEFVMHAGGIEVEDPMKKITVYFGPF